MQNNNPWVWNGPMSCPFLIPHWKLFGDEYLAHNFFIVIIITLCVFISLFSANKYSQPSVKVFKAIAQVFYRGMGEGRPEVRHTHSFIMRRRAFLVPLSLALRSATASQPISFSNRHVHWFCAIMYIILEGNTIIIIKVVEI